jgi:hypothetical protein
LQPTLPTPPRDEDAYAAAKPPNNSMQQSKKTAGKRPREAAALSDDSAEELLPTKRGRPSGSTNFHNAEVQKLLDLVESGRPQGPKGWHKVSVLYNNWALRGRRPERTLKSLESKFKQVMYFFE